MIEPRDDGHGLALAAFLSANAGGLVLGQQDFPGFAACAGALCHGSFANLARDGALKRCSIKQTCHEKDCTRFASHSEPKMRWIELARGLTSNLPKNASARGCDCYILDDNIFLKKKSHSGTFFAATVDRTDCCGYPFRSTFRVFASYVHRKRDARRNVRRRRLACQC